MYPDIFGTLFRSKFVSPSASVCFSFLPIFSDPDVTRTYCYVVLRTIMETHEFVVPRSIPITSPASSDLNRRAKPSKAATDMPGEAAFFAVSAAALRRNSVEESILLISNIFCTLCIILLWVNKTDRPRVIL